MESGINTYKDLIEIIASILTGLGFIAIVFGVFSYKLSKKQLNFSVMARCIQVYHDKFASISNKSKIEDIKAYIEFVNEQLFYFESKYIAEPIAKEWIDGMIELIPIYDSNNKLLNSAHSLKSVVSHNMFQSYTRVRNAFTVKHDYDFQLIYANAIQRNEILERGKERKKLINEIYDNLF
jgi:hypothetical protein